MADGAGGQGAAPHLLDLPEDVLLRIGLHLKLHGRLQLAGVCRKLRQLCAGPSELWRVLQVVLRGEEGEEAALRQLVCFRRWLRPRLPAVEHLVLSMWAQLAHAAPVALLKELLAGLPHQPPLPLARLTIGWAGPVDFSPNSLQKLPALRSLAFYGSRLRVTGPLLGAGAERSGPGGQLAPPSLLTNFTVDGGQLLGALQGPWLPPSVTSLKLDGCQLEGLPGRLLAGLPHLRSLSVHRNPLRFNTVPSPLLHCTALEMLNISCCGLRRFPSAISALTRLKILYLHGAFNHSAAPVAEAAWEALRPLNALRFLAISGNCVPTLPPAVAQMSHLLALHCEQNRFGVLPVGPYLCGLRELLLGWDQALRSPAALHAATRLSRLVLWRTALHDAPMDPVIDLPVEAGEALVETLAAMPALRRVDDNMKHPGSYLLWPAVAQAMWRMGQRCPHLQLGVLQSKSIGWGMSRLRKAEEEEEQQQQQEGRSERGRRSSSRGSQVLPLEPGPMH